MSMKLNLKKENAEEKVKSTLSTIFETDDSLLLTQGHSLNRIFL